MADVVGSTTLPQLQANGRVKAIAVSGGTEYIGGKFTSLRPSGDPSGTGEVPRTRLAAIDIAGGSLLPWSPVVTSGAVRAIAADGTTVVVGGSFQRVNQARAIRLAALDPTTGAILWTADLNGAVDALAIQGGMVYAGGEFTSADGVPVTYVAAFDESTGALDTTFAPTLDASVQALAFTADGSKLMIGGYFTSIDGVHHGYLAAIDPTSGTPVSTWRSEGTGFPVLAIAVDSARVYAGGAGPGGRFVAYDTNLGRRLWVDGTDGNVQAIAVLDGVVYAGGHFTEFCGSTGHKTCAGVRRMKILAADGPTGALEEWDPGANSTLGVWSLAADPASLSLFVGGDFTTIGGTDQESLAEFDE